MRFQDNLWVSKIEHDRANTEVVTCRGERKIRGDFGPSWSDVVEVSFACRAGTFKVNDPVKIVITTDQED